ncbi:MAG: cryptochrome/photolyase family protein [Caulobacterales bacterium]|uniref:cryptochrome/photolyase family protein n=1 Tax=Glycocaulis sp. TaxID=1969725 RepID=UPI003F9F218B
MSNSSHSASSPVLVWFRQDLRLADNPALNAAVHSGAPVVCLYVLDDATPGRWMPGGASRWWLHHSLKSLDQSLQAIGGRLVLRRGDALKVVTGLAQELQARAVYWNRCYEPYARARDTKIKAQIRDAGYEAETFNGSLMREPWEVTTKDGGPYRVYTPYFRALSAQIDDIALLPAPQKLNDGSAGLHSDGLTTWDLLPTAPDWASGFTPVWTPGETGAHKRLGAFAAKCASQYDAKRNLPGIAGTSRLSPHLHFGEVSPRQVWSHVVSNVAPGSGRETFLKEIGWREFSYSLLYHFDDLPESNYQSKFNDFPWDFDENAFKRWTRGQTGYPIVDAGMRQLWQTGWMHNRVRMIVASFLTKHLLMDWRRGEEWFWDTLVDADLASNSASWQWVAGSGADAAPYFRIFNPVTQGEKFDASGDYVRHWVPEIAALPDKHLHAPWAAPSDVRAKAGIVLGRDYPHPVVDHGKARERALAAYASLKDAA